MYRDPGGRSLKPQPMSARRNTYTAYSIGCAGVWSVILLLARRRLDSETRNRLWLVCGEWWMGWTSATIARGTFYPPPTAANAGGREEAAHRVDRADRARPHQHHSHACNRQATA